LIGEGGGGLSQIFISYARSTATQAQAIAEALRALGYGVWRDDEIPANRPYAEVIQERLTGAKAVVVIWSAEAAKSQWVFSEANRAREDGKLVQLTVDGARLPMPFDSIQCASLAGWTGDDSPAWKQVVGAIAGLASPSQSRQGSQAARKLAICVLPFTNISGDPEQEYFSDGISEDIITDLSKVSALDVCARNTAFGFKGKSPNIKEVAEQLGVSHVLEGSVRKSGARVRITAQLIDGSTGNHLWAERYDRDLHDIFALQDEISQAIVSALKVKLLPAEKKAIEKRGTASPEAYDLYLMARKVREGGNSDARCDEDTIRLCERAVAIDPGYARAWALMAFSQSGLFYRFSYANDAGAAATARALALDPDLAEAHAIQARQLHRTGHGDEAYAEMAVALRLDPDSFEVNNQAGTIHYLDGRFAEATRYFRACAAASETDFNLNGMLISCLMALGDREGALQAARITLERVERALAESPSNGYALSLGVIALALLGERERARQWIDRALLLDPDNLAMRYNFACAFSLHLGDTDGALALLGPALASHDATLLESARLDPDLDPIRGDPRFQALMAAAEARLAKAET
jgi:adenylate cyclase